MMKLLAVVLLCAASLQSYQCLRIQTKVCKNSPGHPACAGYTQVPSDPSSSTTDRSLDKPNEEKSLPFDLTDDSVSDMMDEYQRKNVDRINPIYPETGSKIQDPILDNSLDPMYDDSAAKFPSSGSSQPCPDCNCAACPSCPPTMDYHTLMSRLGSFKDFCACPSVVCKPHCPEPVVTCHPANLSCPEPVLTVEQSNNLKMIQLLRDQTENLQAAVRHQDNQEMIRKFEAWTAESDRRWLACQSKVQHCQPRYSEYDFDQCSLARLPRGERYLVCYDDDAVHGNFSDLPSNVMRLLEAVPALQGVTEIFRGNIANETRSDPTPDGFPLNPELLLVFSTFAVLGLVLGFILVVLLPYLCRQMARNVRSAYNRINTAARSFTLPTFPRIIWGSGPGSNLTPPDLHSPLASPGVSASTADSGQKRVPGIVPPKSPPPDPPQSPPAGAKQNNDKTFKETQFCNKTMGPSNKKNENDVSNASKGSSVRVTKGSESPHVVIRIENDKTKSDKNSAPSSSASSKSSDTASPSDKGKVTPGQIVKNKNKLPRIKTVDEFSSLVRTKDRRTSGPSRGWLRARANDKSRRQQVAELFKR